MAKRPYSRLTAEQKRKIAFRMACYHLETSGSRVGLDLLYKWADEVAGRDVHLSDLTIAKLRKAGRARYALEREMFARGVQEMCR